MFREAMPAAGTLTHNRIALIFLILGKALGVGGLVLGAVHRVGGGTLLALDGIFITVAIVLCLRASKQQVLEANSDKATLARLLREGTLHEYLREVERERRDEERVDAKGSVEAAAE